MLFIFQYLCETYEIGSCMQFIHIFLLPEFSSTLLFQYNLSVVFMSILDVVLKVLYLFCLFKLTRLQMQKNLS